MAKKLVPSLFHTQVIPEKFKEGEIYLEMDKNYNPNSNLCFLIGSHEPRYVTVTIDATKSGTRIYHFWDLKKNALGSMFIPGDKFVYFKMDLPPELLRHISGYLGGRSRRYKRKYRSTRKYRKSTSYKNRRPKKY